MPRSLPLRFLISADTESPPLLLSFTLCLKTMAVLIVITIVVVVLYALLYQLYLLIQCCQRGIHQPSERSVTVSRENQAELVRNMSLRVLIPQQPPRQHQGPNNHVCRTATSSSDLIDSLSSFTFGSVAGECVVCLSSFERKDPVRQLPLCRHMFHVSCIDMWLTTKDTCPLCRSTVKLTSKESIVYYGGYD